MYRFKTSAMLIASLFITQAYAQSNSSADITNLQRELATVRAEYEARISALEQKLQSANKNVDDTGVASQTSVNTSRTVSTRGDGFNPAISLILSGTYTRTQQDPEQSAISGIHLAKDAEIGLGQRGLSLAESELGISANIDPWLRGAAHIAFSPDNEVSIEEAYIQTTALGHGLSIKAGRFFSGIGYLNSQHAHTWDFVDSPLAYQAFLGSQYNDDGVQFNWVLPTTQFVELGAELGRGKNFPGTDANRNGVGMQALTLHTGGDIGENQSWRAGVSFLNNKANEQELVLDTQQQSIESLFTGKTSTWVADAVWKWAPNGNATRTYFKLQGEYVRSSRSGTLVYDPAQTASSDAYEQTQSGWYLQGVYQFMPRWRVGLRTERLNPGDAQYGINTAFYSQSDYHPSKNSLMLDFSPSEFSRVRLQLAQDKAREGITDNQLILQYQMNLGAHGAHSF